MLTFYNSLYIHSIAQYILCLISARESILTALKTSTRIQKYVCVYPNSRHGKEIKLNKNTIHPLTREFLRIVSGRRGRSTRPRKQHNEYMQSPVPLPENFTPRVQGTLFQTDTMPNSSSQKVSALSQLKLRKNTYGSRR